MPTADIVVVGSYNKDVTLSVARLPAPGETLLALSRSECPGGKGCNQAIQAARCGAATAMIAAVGEDAAGDEALALWAEAGIDARAVRRLGQPGTGLAFLLVDAAGENMITVDSGANAHVSVDPVAAASELIAGARLVIAQLETPVAATLAAFTAARAAGALTLLNAAPAPEAVAPDLLAVTDYLIVNEGEGRALSGHDHATAIGETLLRTVGKGVVVTLGAEGAMLFEHHRPPRRAPSPAVEVVDTVGAGDAFVGAFAARLVATGDSGEALNWGVAAGALACGVRGAVASLAEASRIEALARTNLH